MHGGRVVVVRATMLARAKEAMRRETNSREKFHVRISRQVRWR